MSNTRRVFLMQVVAGASVVAASNALAQSSSSAKASKDLPVLDEKNAQAQALGYAVDTNKVDAKKYPKHVKEQQCSNCNLYKALADQKEHGACSIFPANKVGNKAWCSAWIKKV